MQGFLQLMHWGCTTPWGLVRSIVGQAEVALLLLSLLVRPLLACLELVMMSRIKNTKANAAKPAVANTQYNELFRISSRALQQLISG